MDLECIDVVIYFQLFCSSCFDRDLESYVRNVEA